MVMYTEPERWVVVVDDDESTRELLVEALALARIRAVACESGDDALWVARRVRPAVVVTDLHMEGMDGLALARELSRLEHPPIVLALTGDRDVGVEVQRTFWALISKPANPLEVAAIVARLVHEPAAPKATRRLARARR